MRVKVSFSIVLPIFLSLLFSGCSRDENSFRSLNLDVGDIDVGVVIKPKAIVIGDVNAPQVANFLIGRGYEVTDVPYVEYEATEHHIDGDYIVWSDNRNGNRDIYAYQISTKTEFSVTTAAGNQQLPQVSGDYIVWEDYRDGNADIYAYQISTETEFPIVINESHQKFPQIDGDYVVWQDQRNGLADIYAYRFSSQEEIAISLQEGEQWTPKIKSDYVVWQSYVNGFSDIYAYQISTATLFPISTATGSQYQPVLSDKYVVWLDNSSGDDNIYAYDLATELEIEVSVAAGQQWRPQVAGEYVVWQDFRNGNYDIYAYHFTSQMELAISTNPALQSYPIVEGDLIVWQDFRNGNYDVFSYQLSTGLETQVSSHHSLQARPLISDNRITWLDGKRGVVDVMLREGIEGDDQLVSNTWLTPAGAVNDASGYDIVGHELVILGSDIASDEIMLAVFDAADAANVPMISFGGIGVSLAASLASAGRYGIQVTPDSGCSEMRVEINPEILASHTLVVDLSVKHTLDLEQELAEGMDELAITTDASASDSPLDWAVIATFHEHMCNKSEPAIVEFTTALGTRVLLDGAASVADKYRYWSAHRWTLLRNEAIYIREAKTGE